VEAHTKPAVYISGGLDSTILLYHLTEKTKEQVFTYTAGFQGDNEFREARRVAEHYETRHREVLIDDIAIYGELQRHLEKPQYNLWPYFLAEAAHQDGRKACYIGEGLDEHFGGYWNKNGDYLECWTNHYVYVMPAYATVHNLFGLHVEAPFTRLNFKQTLPFWDQARKKTALREAYKDIVPTFVLDRKKNAPHTPWELFFKTETREEGTKQANCWVTREWLRSHESLPRF